MDKQIKRYIENGWCVIPVPYKDKKPKLTWGKYQTQYPPKEELREWFGDDTLTNVALVCGKISDSDYWHIVLDIDDIANYHKLTEKVETTLGRGKLCNLIPIVRTSRGYHLHFYVKQLVKSCNFPTLEIKSDGALALLPPSRNSAGRPYEWVNEKVVTPLTIDSLLSIGIDVNQAKPKSADPSDNWISQAMQGVKKGERDFTCTRLAGYYLGQGIPPDIVKTTLYPFAERCEQPPGKPFTTKDVDKTVDSVWRSEYTKNSPSTIGVYKDTLFDNATEKQNLASKRDNIGITSGKDWGVYAKKFDEVMRNSEGRQDKREVAETIELRATSDTFRKLLQRRKDEGKVRAYRGSHYLIEWINRDYAVTQLDKAETSSMLDLKFALKIHEYANVPPGSVIGFAGMVSGGKTSALLETAELNVFTQPKPVYYWYNEMSEGKLIYRCEDFPHLSQAQKEGKFFPVKQGNFEFADVLQPDAINLIDYIDRDDDVFLIGRDIKELYQQLNTGVIIFALQKKPHLDFGYGGYMSVKLSNLYITLEKRYESGKSMHGVAKIVKCKDWANNEVNPCNLQCEYHSGGLHGKLFVDGEWKRTK